ncbi:hypothetical protein IWX62_002614 [Arthrobacter sp. CAN_A1]
MSSAGLKEQWTNEDAWSIFDLASTTSGFDVFYVFFVAVAILTMLGIGGKPILVLQYIGTWSLFSQNSLLGDGGDNLMYICGIFLLLTRCFDRFTVLPREPSRRYRFRTRWIPSWLSMLTHNTGVLLIAMQVCIVYFIAGSFKMQGEMWTSGTALYYVLRNPEYHLPGIEFLFYFAFPSVVATYVTVISQVFFPLLILFQRTRLAAVILMMMFHLGIAVIMGLTSFGLIMLACDTIFVSHHLAKLTDKIMGRPPAPQTAPGPGTPQSSPVDAESYPLETTDRPSDNPGEQKVSVPDGDSRKAPS